MSFSRNIGYRAAAEVLAKGGSLLVTIAAGRALGRDTYGTFALAWATGWLLATASDLGLHLTAVRETVQTDDPEGRVASGAIAAKLVLTVPALVALVFAAPLGGGSERLAFALVGL